MRQLQLVQLSECQWATSAEIFIVGRKQATSCKNLELLNCSSIDVTCTVVDGSVNVSTCDITHSKGDQIIPRESGLCCCLWPLMWQSLWVKIDVIQKHTSAVLQKRDSYNLCNCQKDWERNNCNQGPKRSDSLFILLRWSSNIASNVWPTAFMSGFKFGG